MPSQPQGPFCARRRQLFFCANDAGGGMRTLAWHRACALNETYEHHASSPAARGGVKPSCVSITAGSFLERTHRRARCPPTVPKYCTRYCSRSFEGRKRLERWSFGQWLRWAGNTKSLSRQRHGRGNLLRPPWSLRLAADAPKGSFCLRAKQTPRLMIMNHCADRAAVSGQTVTHSICICICLCICYLV